MASVILGQTGTSFFLCFFSSGAIEPADCEPVGPRKHLQTAEEDAVVVDASDVPIAVAAASMLEFRDVQRELGDGEALCRDGPADRGRAAELAADERDLGPRKCNGLELFRCAFPQLRLAVFGDAELQVAGCNIAHGPASRRDAGARWWLGNVVCAVNIVPCFLGDYFGGTVDRHGIGLWGVGGWRGH